MGFGVSGATAVVMLGLFISAGLIYDAASTSYERVDEAEDDHDERLLDRRNTELTTTNVSAGTDDLGNLTVSVENTGSTTLSVEDTDLLVDNVLAPKSGNVTWAVGGDETTDAWLPGETLNVTVPRETLDSMLGSGVPPERVKLVTETGVSDVEAV
jgi:flagellar protein FlaF